jgi:D-alanyl-D-alanine carboxypeptidase
VFDAATGKRLYGYLPNLPWSAASLTKLMTTLVASDHLKNVQSVVAISSKDEVGGGRLRVNSGAKLTVNDLFYSAIVASANNAAMALARLSGISAQTFVTQMNQRAKTLGLTHTSFVEPSGMDPKNQTTATDMAALARAAFSNQKIRSAATTASYRFTIRNTGEIKTITNTNKLLTKDPEIWVLGGKTGFLYESMHNLVVKVTTGPEKPGKPPLYVVVFGSADSASMFGSAKGLAKWAWNAYDWSP